MLLAASAPAFSATSALRLDLEAPAGCTDPRGFLDAVRARLPGARLARPGEQALLVRVRVVRAGAQTRGELRVVFPEGTSDTRSIEGASCADVVSSLSLTTALVIEAYSSPNVAPAPSSSSSPANTSASTQPNGTSDRSEADRPAGTPARPPPKPPPPAPPNVAAAAEQRAPAAVSPPGEGGSVEFGTAFAAARVFGDHWSSGPGVWVSASPAPEPAPGFRLALLYLDDAWLAGRSGLVSRWLGAVVDACPWRARVLAGLRAEPCLVLSAGRLSVENSDLTNARSAARLWLGTGVTLRGAFELGRHGALGAEFGVSRPLVERRFVTQNPEQEVGRTLGIAMLVALSAGYRL